MTAIDQSRIVSAADILSVELHLLTTRTKVIENENIENYYKQAGESR